MAEPQPSRRRDNREIWGDEPEEVDASAVVEEIESDFPRTQLIWHERAIFVPFKAVALFIKRSGKRIAITIIGGLIVLLGIAMLVLPGPGLLVIIAGLAILATEYVWAERMLAEAKRRAIQAKDVVTRKNSKNADADGDSTA